MGARDCTRASGGVVGAHLGLLVGASMGARDCTRASVLPLPTPPYAARLQWGRAIVRAQAVVSKALAEPGDRASMGARDCTRASVAERGRRDPGERASMGARDCMRASIDDRVTTLRALALQWGRAIVRAQADDGALAP